MSKFAQAAVLAVGFAVVSAMALPLVARAADLPPGLQSFGAAKAKSAYELSATGMPVFAPQPQLSASLGGNAGLTAVGAPLGLYTPSFASSSVLSQTLALDVAKGVDVASRFASHDAAQSPFASAITTPFLDLANGGRYAGLTFVPSSDLRMRAGVSLAGERLDRFAFSPLVAGGKLALAYDPSQTRSLLAGLSWDISSAMGLDVTGISAVRNGVPLGLENTAGIAPRASTNAIGLSAHMNLGQGWVTTASLNEGMTQLNQRDGQRGDVREQSYAIAIAKHGLFGEDALGLSLSRPASGMAGNFTSLIGSGDLPPLVVARGQALGTRATETDFQLGYVTNFLDGAVALQTNAAYQMNYQGQTGATSLSLLSRAKIKF